MELTPNYTTIRTSSLGVEDSMGREWNREDMVKSLAENLATFVENGDIDPMIPPEEVPHYISGNLWPNNIDVADAWVELSEQDPDLADEIAAEAWSKVKK